MTDLQSLLRELRQQSESRVVLLVADGLGGLPITPRAKTELEAAQRHCWTLFTARDPPARSLGIDSDSIPMS